MAERAASRARGRATTGADGLRMNAAQLRRYSRHLLIPEVGLAGQERLQSSAALVVGAGGLGSPALQYLAAAGIGRIGVVDDDVVDETNLQRQTLFGSADVGRRKASVAAHRLHALNPSIEVEALALRLNAENARNVIRSYDCVLDCTDRFETRYLINDACVLEGRPNVYGSIFRFDAQVSVFAPGAPCYRCLYPEAPPPSSVPTCAEGGVLGALAGIAGAWQASEALKVLLEAGEPLVGRLLLLDALRSRVTEVRYDRDPNCAACGNAPTIFDTASYLYAESESTARSNGIAEVEAEGLDEALARATLLDVREPHEAVLGSLEGAVRIPASQLEARMSELDSASRYVVACRVGSKSLWAAHRLREAGFGRLLHLRGGLLAYAARHGEFEFF
ncbi:MAG: molybdopterin-synthase adenylyltransferase MoeB [Candidatus Eremiobacteraeota bacterium]|nr:molybdopterin-synthase adenylyltransferase MoeB [Candidatus Eremiobacteraeota bacterium]